MTGAFNIINADDANKTPSQHGDGIGHDGREWFYTDLVKDHFFNPRNIFKTREEAEEFEKEADGIGLVGSPACIDGNTLIHVNFDVIPMNKLDSSHKVLSHDGNYNKITRFYRPEYGGKIVTIKNQLGTAMLTPDHLVYAVQIPRRSSYAHNEYKRKAPASWVHAGDLKTGDICLYPVPKEIRKCDYINIPYQKKKFDFRSKRIPRKIKITKQLLRLFGYYVAEGHTKNGQITFTFGIDEKNFVSEVRRSLGGIFNLGSTVVIKEDHNKIDVVANSVHLARYLRKNCGVLAPNKKIPEFIFFLEPKLQAHFLYGLWHGDGYIKLNDKKPRAEYSTTSWILAQELKVLLLRQRIAHSIYFEPAKIVKGVHHKKCYRLHVGDFESLKAMAKILKVNFYYPEISRIARHSWFDDNHFYFPIRKISQGKFEGRLNNLEVEDAHSYVSDAFTLHNCGDGMKIFIKIDKETKKLKKVKYQTFGCGTAIASTSAYSVMLTENGGKTIEEALQVKPKDIADYLGGIPARKFHCSVLADKAFREAVNDYYRKTGQEHKIKTEGKQIVDKVLKITDHDIEHAVLEGAMDFDAVQKKTKVGVHDKECIPVVNKLIETYKKKYYGEN